MSSDWDPTEGLCSLCSTISISIPYEEHAGQNQPSNGLKSKARIDNRQQHADWRFKYGTASYVLQSARRGCSFCFLVALAFDLHYRYPRAADEEPHWLLLKVEGDYIVPKLVRNGILPDEQRIFRISPWEPALDVRQWVQDGQTPWPVFLCVN